MRAIAAFASIAALLAAWAPATLADDLGPWQQALRNQRLGSPVHATADEYMKPVAPYDDRWHAVFVLRDPKPAGPAGGRLERIDDSAFCHGAVLNDTWVLTAASCVCPSANAWALVLSPRTSRAYETVAKRIDAVFVFQVAAGSPPNACAARGTADANLALVQYSSPEGQPKRRRLTMIAEDEQRKELIGRWARTLQLSSTARLEVESVVLATTSSARVNALPVDVVAEYVHRQHVRLATPGCGVDISFAAGQGDGGTVYSICGKNTAATGQSASGTPALLADHRDPVLLGIYGLDATNGPQFTSLSRIVLDSAGSLTIGELVADKLGEDRWKKYWVKQ